MRILTSTVLIVLFGLLAHLFLPWWIIAIVVFIISLGVNKTAGQAAASGFFAVFLLWLGTAVYQTSGNGDILVERMGGVLPISGILLYLVTALMGGIIGLLSSLTGYFLRAIGE